MRRAVTCALTPASRVARMPSALAPSPAEVRESLLRRREPISELAADLLELVDGEIGAHRERPELIAEGVLQLAEHRFLRRARPRLPPPRHGPETIRPLSRAERHDDRA